MVANPLHLLNRSVNRAVFRTGKHEFSCTACMNG